MVSCFLIQFYLTLETKLCSIEAEILEARGMERVKWRGANVWVVIVMNLIMSVR